MRFHPTHSEMLLWSRLKGRQLGVPFKRQVVIAGAIVDFAAPSASLIVEVDGASYHQHRPSADAARDRKLVRAGYTIVRVPASLVERRLSSAVQVVLVALGQRLAA